MKEKISSIKGDNLNARFHRLLLDHLISNGFYECALVLLEEDSSTSNSAESSHNLSQFSNEIAFAKKVNHDLLNGDFETALEWCSNNSARLRAGRWLTN